MPPDSQTPLIDVLRAEMAARGWTQTMEGQWFPKLGRRRRKADVPYSLMAAVETELRAELYERRRAAEAIEMGVDRAA